MRRDRLLRHLSVIDVCRDTTALRLPTETCGCSGAITPDHELWIRRVGECDWVCSYPVFDTLADGTLDFRLDRRLWDAKPGMHELIFATREECQPSPPPVNTPVCGGFVSDRPGNCGAVTTPPQQAFCCDIIPCAYLNLHASKINCDGITTLKMDQTSSECELAAPEGRDPMFDHLIGFCAPTGTVLEKSSTEIALSDADKATLCDTVICKPVELQLYDRVNTETVVFSGCSAGAVVVERGSPAFKFPQGSLLKFAWTSTNVTTSMEGC